MAKPNTTPRATPARAKGATPAPAPVLALPAPATPAPVLAAFAKVAANIAAPATPAPVAATGTAPRFVVGPWPVKAQGGATVRAYCYAVAKALCTQVGAQGFTLAEYAAALAASADTLAGYKQPSGGWGSAAKPNGVAHAHANWFGHAKQGWLAPVAK